MPVSIRIWCIFAPGALRGLILSVNKDGWFDYNNNEYVWNENNVLKISLKWMLALVEKQQDTILYGDTREIALHSFNNISLITLHIFIVFIVVV